MLKCSIRGICLVSFKNCATRMGNTLKKTWWNLCGSESNYGPRRSLRPVNKESSKFNSVKIVNSSVWPRPRTFVVKVISHAHLILNGNFDKDLDDGDVDELMASQMQKEQNRISLKRQSNIQKSLSNPVSPTESNMDRRRSSVVSHKRSSRTSTISRGRSSIIGGKRVSVMDPTMDLDLENNPRLMETRPSKTEPQKPTRRSSRSSKLSKDSVASVMQPYQYTPDSSDQTLVRVARYRFGFLHKILSNFLKLIITLSSI